MKISIGSMGLLFFIVASQSLFGQGDGHGDTLTNEEKALSKGREAIRLMDEGSIEASITLLEEARTLDPVRFDWPYELAYAHFLKDDYKGTIAILEEMTGREYLSERYFQLLGNTYDIIGRSEQAFEIYEAGLRKFPSSGMIMLEMGNVYWIKKEYEKAVPWYERGIKSDPAFPSNYYRAAIAYCNSKEKVWGLIYGEIFINLERNTKRTAEISKLLYDTYREGVTIKSPTSKVGHYCENVLVLDSNGKMTNPKLPFCTVFGPTLMLSMAFEKSIDMESLDRIRKEFVRLYFELGHDKTYPNVLFDYQRSVAKAGHLEAYNHLILMKGDPDACEKWYRANKGKWSAFLKWFDENPIELNETHRFFRAQYDQ